METRANHVWVGAVTLVLMALVVAFVIWIARINKGDQNYYDIFFSQSVDGLAKGGQVTFSGVPAGQIKTIELWKNDPGLVRVRIAVNEKVPILQGTAATIQSSFTGVSTIQLTGGKKGAPPITAPGRAGVPEIPTQRGGFGAIMASTALAIDKVAAVSERLTLLLSDQNQQHIAGILANTDRMTGHLADTSPQLNKTLAELQATLKQASTTLASFDATAHNADKLLAEQGKPLAEQLRQTLASAKQAADQLNATLVDARPAAHQLTASTLPQADATLRELRTTTQALRALTEKIDDQGAASVLGPKPVPEYHPR